jgi:hypothetical protein
MEVTKTGLRLDYFEMRPNLRYVGVAWYEVQQQACVQVEAAKIWPAGGGVEVRYGWYRSGG